MAVDTYPKAVNLADDIMKASVALMDALRQLETLDEEHASSGLNLAGLEFPNPDASNAVGRRVELSQCTGDDLMACLTSGTAVKQFADANFHSTNFDKVRP